MTNLLASMPACEDSLISFLEQSIIESDSIGYDSVAVDRMKNVVTAYIGALSDANVSQFGAQPHYMYFEDGLCSEGSADSLLEPEVVNTVADTSVWRGILASPDPLGAAAADARAGSFVLRTVGTTYIPRPVGAPVGFALAQNDPNPGIDAIRISFSLPGAGRVKLRLFDLAGREVRTLFSGSLNAGAHEARLDGRSLQPGLYLYRLEAGGCSLTRHLVLVR